MRLINRIKVYYYNDNIVDYQRRIYKMMDHGLYSPAPTNVSEETANRKKRILTLLANSRTGRNLGYRFQRERMSITDQVIDQVISFG